MVLDYPLIPNTRNIFEAAVEDINGNIYKEVPIYSEVNSEGVDIAIESKLRNNRLIKRISSNKSLWANKDKAHMIIIKNFLILKFLGYCFYRLKRTLEDTCSIDLPEYTIAGVLLNVYDDSSIILNDLKEFEYHREEERFKISSNKPDIQLKIKFKINQIDVYVGGRVINIPTVKFDKQIEIPEALNELMDISLSDYTERIALSYLEQGKFWMLNDVSDFISSGRNGVYDLERGLNSQELYWKLYHKEAQKLDYCWK